MTACRVPLLRTHDKNIVWCNVSQMAQNSKFIVFFADYLQLINTNSWDSKHWFCFLWTVISKKYKKKLSFALLAKRSTYTHNILLIYNNVEVRQGDFFFVNGLYFL